MSSNNSKINLVPYFNTAWTVQLDESFRLELKEKVRGNFTIKELSSLTGKSLDSIWNFHRGKYNASFDYLLKLCKLLDVPKEELVDNITGIYLKNKSSHFDLNELEITPIFTEWYGAWIGDGDHSPKREALSLTNYSVDLLRLHVDILIKFGFEKSRPYVEVYTPSKEKKNKIKERWSTILNLPLNQITTVTYMANATQEGARVGFKCATLFRILHLIDNEIKSVIKNSDNKIKIAYIKGIFAAEGSVRKKGKEIRLNMRNEPELIFAKDILNDLNINTIGPRLNKSNNCYGLSIFGYRNIKKFKDIKGFGLEKKRANLLESVFESYEKKLPYEIRFDRIKDILLKKSEISNMELVRIFGCKYNNISSITKLLVKKCLLKVDKSSKVYKYSLVDTTKSYD